MQKIIKQPMLAIAFFAFMLQSCNREPLDLQPGENRLLLSQVSGQFADEYFTGLNSFMYNDAGNFLQGYSYGNRVRHSYKPLQQVGFINTGSWDFSFDRSLPDKTTDNSLPGLDLGYWKYYYGRNGLIEKTGLSFGSAEEPREFEFYTYDNNLNLTSLVYGTAIDNPFFKIEYYYDCRGNMDSFKYFTILVDPTARMNTGNTRKQALVAALMRPGIVNEGKIVQIQKTGITGTAGNAANRPSANTAITYLPILTGKITTDNKINPFRQQGRLLFYQTNRYYIPNMLDFYISLLKHNPVSVSYELVPELGGMLATDVFTYTYNRSGYPITLHQERNDPDFLEFYNYTQDKQITYIRNDD